MCKQVDTIPSAYFVHIQRRVHADHYGLVADGPYAVVEYLVVLPSFARLRTRESERYLRTTHANIRKVSQCFVHRAVGLDTLVTPDSPIKWRRGL
ncbi:MAG: hypothetical protein RIA65_00315 [Woeseia sp.]